MADPTAAGSEDITASPAFTFLEELLASGKLTSAQVQLYRSKYSKLHDVVLKTYENEKNLLKKAKVLNQDLSGERAKLDKATAQAQEDSEAIAALKAEVAKGESERVLETSGWPGAALWNVNVRAFSRSIQLK